MDALLVEEDEKDARLVDAALDSYRQAHPKETIGLCWVADKAELLHALDNYVWSVVLTAYTMDEMPWPEVLRIVRGKGLSTPIIVVSRSLTDDQGVETIRNGAADFLSKQDLHRLGHVIVRETLHAKAFKDMMSVHAAIQNGGIAGGTH